MPPPPEANREADRIVDALFPVAVDTLYSYRVPPELTLAPGDFVVAPLGTRTATGVVWSLREGDGGNLKSITARRDWPPLRAPLRDFIDWVANWTLAPRGMVLRMATRGPEAAPQPAPKLARAADRQAAGPPDAGARARAGGARLTARRSANRRSPRAAGCGVGVIDGLVADGALEFVALDPEPATRAARPGFFAPYARARPAHGGGSARQRGRGARAPRDPARRRHRLGQDRSLFRSGRRRLAREAPGAGAVAGDRADRAVPRPLRGALRRAPGRMAFGDHAAPARAAVGRGRERRSASRRRRALGSVPALRRSRPDRRR